MKKRVMAGTAVGLLLFGGVAWAGGQVQKIEVFFERIHVAVNGQQAELSKDSILYNGSVYVPLRSVGEMLGAEVAWDNDKRTVSLDFLKDRTEEAKLAAAQGLYQYIAFEQNRILKNMVQCFKTDDMESMKQVVADYGHLRDLAADLDNGKLTQALDKMMAAIELLRSGWAVKQVDDYSLAWWIYSDNAAIFHKELEAQVSGSGGN